MALTRHDWMVSWVTLVHSGTWLIGALDEHLKEKLGISAAEQDLLKQVAVNDGEIKLSELARLVYMSKPGMTKMIDRLEKNGLVKRVASSADRRAVSAVLTRRGATVFNRSRKVLESFVEETFRRNLSDDEIVRLREILQGFLERSGRWEGQARHLRGEADGG